MTTLLLDSDVLLAAFDPDDNHHEPASALLLDAETTLATLDLARYEVANVAVRAWRAPSRSRRCWPQSSNLPTTAAFSPQPPRS